MSRGERSRYIGRYNLDAVEAPENGVWGIYPTGAEETLLGDDSLSLDSYSSYIYVDGGNLNLILPDATVAGTRKRMWAEVASAHSAKVAFSDTASSTKFIYLDTTDEYADLIWTGTHWLILSSAGITIQVS